MFRRRRPAPDEDGAEADESAVEETTTGTTGPWDVGDADIDPDDPNRIDLGSLVVRGRPDIEVRLQVDDATQTVVSAMLVAENGAVELRPFAAPRSEGIWDSVRKEIAAEATRRGGTASEVDGAFGRELRVVVPMTGPDGSQVTQPSRVVGVDGPRWMLRATFLGQPAVESDPDGLLEQAFRDVVVVRGTTAMPPREALPLIMPGGARVVPPDDI
jgi:hypothetical protein